MPLTVASTTSIVASIPALTGFVPHDSLLLITALTHDDGSVTTGPLMRADLAHLTDNAADCVRQFNRQCADLPVLCVTGIVVCAVDDAGDSLPLRADVHAVVALLAEHGFTDTDIVHVPAIADGARWRSYRDPERTGVLPDPATTPAAVATTVAGHTVAARREDLAARFTPAPEHLRERLQQHIADTVIDLGIDAQRPAAAAARIARADTALRAAGRGVLPADSDDIVALAATFATPPFRDALFAPSDYGQRLAAENLLLHLWCHSCDPVAGQLATVIAMHAYLRGDGAGARIALENADPEQPLVRLLACLLDRAVAPSKVRDMVQEASADARRTLLGEPVVEQA
ncbi:DUF4192 domain-containing protein [Amycolatopsis sp. NPDC058278]|uniref:DUF4192 domain-containing protein n=1 Tax=Amycolatopsis sp. NPDC058278 TaxID=3346417 RepID=UPI0036D9F8B6